MRELKPLFDEANRITSECMSGDRERELFDFLQRRKPGKGEQLTNQELEEQSRAAVAAHLQDSSVRLEYTPVRTFLIWAKVAVYSSFDLKEFYYRIAQPKPWYRVGLYSSGVFSVGDELMEKACSNSCNFVKWLTDRVEYDNE